MERPHDRPQGIVKIVKIVKIAKIAESLKFLKFLSRAPAAFAGLHNRGRLDPAANAVRQAPSSRTTGSAPGASMPRRASSEPSRR